MNMSKAFRTTVASAVFCAAATPIAAQAADCVFPVVAKDYHAVVTADKDLDGRVRLSMTATGTSMSLDLNAAHTYVAQYSATNKESPLIFSVAGISNQFGSGGSFKEVRKPTAPAADEVATVSSFTLLKGNVETLAKCSLPAPAFQKTK